ncbi:MAG: SRPBCC domain-containing protein [Phycisphaerales bacterium]|nr:SRPBCC domain-containing protein [Phycisphaerales bacterium]
MQQEYKHSVSFPSDREIRFTREFNGTPQQVWDAFTRPELIMKWMIGPGGWSMPVCQVEARIGGT